MADDYDSRIQEAIDFLKFANDADTMNRQDALEDLKFGSGDQWPVDLQNSRNVESRPCITVNKVDNYCRQVSNQQRQQRPRIKVHATNTHDDMVDAQTIQGIIRHIEVNSNADHAYDNAFAVTNQIEVLNDAAATGLPVFGSCWGLQIAVMAAGGQVEYSPKGREVGIARKIAPNEAGRSHPLLRGKGPAFDAPCIHYDEVSRLPDDAILLASNAHSKVQAAIVPLLKSEVWAVQYHPEFDLDQLVQLYILYAEDMIEQGFFADRPALDNYVSNLSALAADPANQGLGWQLGMDIDITDPKRRRAEIINWVKSCVLHTA